MTLFSGQTDTAGHFLQPTAIATGQIVIARLLYIANGGFPPAQRQRLLALFFSASRLLARSVTLFSSASLASFRTFTANAFSSSVGGSQSRNFGLSKITLDDSFSPFVLAFLAFTVTPCFRSLCHCVRFRPLADSHLGPNRSKMETITRPRPIQIATLTFSPRLRSDANSLESVAVCGSPAPK